MRELLQIAPVQKAVGGIHDKNRLPAFVVAFRKLIRTLNVLKGFTEFKWDDLYMEPQSFEDFKSKYLNINDRTKTLSDDTAASVIDEVDFELELILRDKINVAYTIALLAEAMRDAASLDPKIRNASKAKTKMVYDLLGSERRLRSKRELIEKSIEQHMPSIPESQAA